MDKTRAPGAKYESEKKENCTFSTTNRHFNHHTEWKDQTQTTTVFVTAAIAAVAKAS